MTNKPVSMRLDEEIIQKFDQKIIDQYGTTYKVKNTIIEKLLEDYTNNTTNTIIEEQTQQIQHLEEKLQKQQQHFQQIEDQLQQYKKKYKDIHQELEEKEKTIIKLKDEHQHETEELKQQLHKLEKEKTRWSNEYRHQVTRQEKLQEELNEQQEENKKYIYFFGQVTSMSLLNRILGKYPEEIKELQPATQKEKSTQRKE